VKAVGNRLEFAKGNKALREVFLGFLINEDSWSALQLFTIVAHLINVVIESLIWVVQIYWKCYVRLKLLANMISVVRSSSDKLII